MLLFSPEFNVISNILGDQCPHLIVYKSQGSCTCIYFTAGFEFTLDVVRVERLPHCTDLMYFARIFLSLLHYV